MKKRNLILAIVAIIALSAGILISMPFNAEADNVYDNTYYALRGRKFSVPDYGNLIEVVDPSGDEVTVNDGSFKAVYEGDYVIKYKSGLSVLKVYKTAPAVSIEIGGELPAAMSEGEIIYLPDAVGKSEIKDYDEYVVRFVLGNEASEVSGSDKKFMFEKSGQWSVNYVFTDVFGLETVYSSIVTVTNDPVIVLQNFPKEIAFGESISLGETYGYYGGALYECEAKLSDKIGKTELTGGVFTPRIDGESILTFSAEINGQTIKRSVSINVSYKTQSLFTGSGVSVKENVSYPSGANVEKTGVLLKGNSGSVTTYAKTLDLKKLSETKTNIIEFQPYGKKAGAISQVRITLTDVYDETNTLSVYWWLNPWNDHLSYMLAEYDDISVAISNESADKGVVRNTYGAVVFHNFTNVYNKNCVPFNFRYDYDELTVYSAINKNTPNYKVLDADNTDELKNWKPFGGFKGAEVYLSAEFVVSDGGGIVVSEIGGKKLNEISAADFKNDGAIQITKTGGVETGVVGYGYKLPVAAGYDVVFGAVDVKRTLEVSDGGIYRAVTATDGTLTGDVFTPKNSGKYRAAFSGRDNFGNEIVKYYEFEVISSPNDITIETNAVETLPVRDDFVLPEATVSGGTGTLETTYKISYDGAEFSLVPGDRVILNGKGNVQVRITVTDELGFVKTISYTVKVDMNKIFFMCENFPAAYKAGERVTLPEIKILDYSKYGEIGFEKPAELYIGGVKVLGNYTVPKDASEVEIVAKNNDGSLAETYTIAVIPAKITDISEALIVKGASVTREFFETGLTFSAASDFSIKTPYAVPFYDFSAKLTFLEDSMKFSSVSVEIASAKNPEEKVSLAFSSIKSGKAKLKLGEKTYNVSLESGTFNSLSAYNGRKYDSATIAFSVSGTVRIGGSEAAKITSFDSGRNFTGFDGGSVYMTIKTVGVKSQSSVIVNYIGNQSFNSYTKSGDDAPAIVGFTSELKSEYEKGETFVLPKMCFGDVLSGKAEAKLTVKAPNGKVILNNVIPEAGTEIKLESYGYYQLVFELTDGSYNTVKKTFRLYVADKTSPVIEMPSVKETYKIGEDFVVPEVSVTDDKSALDDDFDPLTVYLYLKNTDEKLVKVTAGESVKLRAEGEYEFIVYAFDASMNISYEIRKFNVVR